MGIKVTIPNTSSDTLTFGSANTTTAAQIAGIDSGSSNGQLALYTTASGTSTERMRIDASGNVGVGVTSPKKRLTVSDASSASTTPGTNPVIWVGGGNVLVNTLSEIGFTYGSTSTWSESNVPATVGFQLTSTAGFGKGALTFCTRDVTTDTAPSERMRIDSSGNLLVGTTSQYGSTGHIVTNTTTATYGIVIRDTAVTTGLIKFEVTGGSTVGSITISGGTSTVYATSSDYRLKENIEPMTGALSVVAALKPCTYTWKSDGSLSQGFIAHELQGVVPDCVVGEKDAVDAEGNPVYQGIDTSFLVATLTAAIQEQQAIITSLTDRITALENK